MKCFGAGFTISICMKMVILGAYNSCESIGDMGNICLIVGGFALIVIVAVGGIVDSISKED